jgi:hypothetical protein
MLESTREGTMIDEAVAARRWRKFSQAAKRLWDREKGVITFVVENAESFEAAIDALPDIGPDAQVFDAQDVTFYTIVIDGKRFPQADIWLTGLAAHRGVIAIKPNVAEPEQYAAVERAKHELRMKVLEVLRADTGFKPLQSP